MNLWLKKPQLLSFLLFKRAHAVKTCMVGPTTPGILSTTRMFTSSLSVCVAWAASEPTPLFHPFPYPTPVWILKPSSVTSTNAGRALVGKKLPRSAGFLVTAWIFYDLSKSVFPRPFFKQKHCIQTGETST